MGAEEKQAFVEIGTAGLKGSAGFLREEFLPELQGRRGMKVYREMRDNSDDVGACLGIVDLLIQQVDWRLEPASEDPRDVEVAAFVESCRHDMSAPWSAVLGEHLTMLPFGFAFSELVYKRREGTEAKHASKHSDGRIGWRKVALRAQETLFRWEIDSEGGIQGMWQLHPEGGRGAVFIPIAKALLMRPRQEGNNPEGRSVLRNAYLAWYFLKRTIEIEGISIDRDLNGLPVFTVPAACMAPDAAPELKAIRSAAESIVKNIRVDQEMGVVLPQSYDGGGNAQYKLELLSTAGRRQHDTNAIIQRWSAKIARTILYDLILMGQPNTIQYKGTSVPNLFASALTGWCATIADVYNAFAIPRLVKLNGWPAASAPRLCHGDIEATDLGKLGDYVSKLAGAGFPLSEDDAVEAYLRRVAGFPEKRPAVVDADREGGDGELALDEQRRRAEEARRQDRLQRLFAIVDAAPEDRLRRLLELVDAVAKASPPATREA